MLFRNVTRSLYALCNTYQRIAVSNTQHTDGSPDSSHPPFFVRRPHVARAHSSLMWLASSLADGRDDEQLTGSGHSSSPLCVTPTNRPAFPGCLLFRSIGKPSGASLLLLYFPFSSLYKLARLLPTSNSTSSPNRRPWYSPLHGSRSSKRLAKGEGIRCPPCRKGRCPTEEGQAVRCSQEEGCYEACSHA